MNSHKESVVMVTTVTSWCQKLFNNWSESGQQVLEPCWDREQRSQLSWGHYLYLKLPEQCCCQLYRPFNMSSSRGPACSRICVCLAAPLSSSLRISLHKPDGHLWCQEEVFAASLSHLFMPVQHLARSLMKSEKVLCVFRSEQFAFFFPPKVFHKRSSDI